MYRFTKRFEFTGDALAVGDCASGGPMSGTEPFQGLAETDFQCVSTAAGGLAVRELHSYQAENGETPALAGAAPVYCETGNAATAAAITVPDGDATEEEYHAGSAWTRTAIGELNTGSLEDLYRFYRGGDEPGRPGAEPKEEVFGARNGTGGAQYHELAKPFSLYGWELCFHAPMQLADHLLASWQFDQALAMCHFVFDPAAKAPTDGTPEEITKRCWQFPPFKEIDAQRVLERIFSRLSAGNPSANITEWRENPFQPHVVARGRPAAYMKYTVMKYIEMLISYGDQYFRQNSMESIPLAVQCYVMAAHLYGPRGQKIPRRGTTATATYNSLIERWDAFGNALVELELAFPFANQCTVAFASDGGDVPLPGLFGFANCRYFGIPENPNLAALRDRIDDRLFKIRHCQNIDGVFQQLPLFEPPIDPALLVQAAAQGLSLSTVLDDLNSPMPNYRFCYLLQKALELCGELKALGSAFLSAREKRDAEALSSLRAGHESGIQNLLLEVRRMQLDEASRSLESLQQSRKAPVARMQYYLKLIGEDLGKVPDEEAEFSEVANQIEAPLDESGLKLIRYEKEEMDRASEAADWQVGIGVVETLGSILHVLPDFATDVKPWGIGAGLTFGGTNLGLACQAVARGLQIQAGHLSYQSSSAARKSGFLRQLQDRVQQANAAGHEIKTIDRQILTQKIRLDLANREIVNQQRQIENSQEVEEFLRDKYTNEELYSWMEGNVRTLYRETYTSAYDLAKKAEKAYQYERPGEAGANVIQYGYWEPGRDGLLAGERLHLALKRLDAGYREKREHDYEITKHVSLRQLNPLALLELRAGGSCEFAIPEVLYDLDYPGHYLRRIKSVALTVPCVVGPYSSLNCTLRLLEHTFRIRPTSAARGYARLTDGDDERFSTVNVPITSIAVSSGQNDSGVFELNFRDERYIPFEGAGAVSKWRIELPSGFRQFNYDTISDVVMHVRYTAVEGGDKLRTSAVANVSDYLENAVALSSEQGLFTMIDLKRDFQGAWRKAFDRTDAAPGRMTSVNPAEHLPAFATFSRLQGKVLIPTATDVYLFSSVDLTAPENDEWRFGAGPSNQSLVVHDADRPFDSWTLPLPDEVTAGDELLMVIRYKLATR